MGSDLNMLHGKESDFVLFPLLGLTLVIKMRNFDFKIIEFLIKKIMSDFIMSCQTVSDLVRCWQ